MHVPDSYTAVNDCHEEMSGREMRMPDPYTAGMQMHETDWYKKNVKRSRLENPDTM
jgi:hypothetical protein